jgi:hypothetical protein
MFLACKCLIVRKKNVICIEKSGFWVWKSKVKLVKFDVAQEKAYVGVRGRGIGIGKSVFDDSF